MFSGCVPEDIDRYIAPGEMARQIDGFGPANVWIDPWDTADSEPDPVLLFAAGEQSRVYGRWFAPRVRQSTVIHSNPAIWPDSPIVSPVTPRDLPDRDRQRFS
jgi:hypothetical protein